MANTSAWEFMQETLKEALIRAGLDEDSILTQYKQILESSDTRPADKLRAIEFVSKWAGWNAPEKKEVKIDGINIGVEEPEDIEI